MYLHNSINFVSLFFDHKKSNHENRLWCSEMRTSEMARGCKPVVLVNDYVMYKSNIKCIIQMYWPFHVILFFINLRKVRLFTFFLYLLYYFPLFQSVTDSTQFSVVPKVVEKSLKLLFCYCSRWSRLLFINK